MPRRTTCFAIVLICAGLLVFAPAARAVDGAVLINQNTSVSGLPGCPHSGFPVVICQSGSYRLSGNLAISDPNTDAIDITANDVTLDLNGFAISGPAICTPGTHPVQCTTSGKGVGVFGSGKNITVRNGTVQGLGNSGINLYAAHALIEDVHVDSNAGGDGGPGIRIGDGVVTHCTVTTNAIDGIFGDSVAASFNNVSTNGGNGISGLRGTVSNNHIEANGQDGVSLYYGGAVSYNTISLNVGFAIRSSFANLGYIGNVFLFNGGDVANGGTSLGHNLCGGSTC